MRVVSISFLLLISIPALSVRLKDIAYLKGVRDNQLMGYGIVIGLSGTGDTKMDLTDSSLFNIIKNLGVELKTPKFQSKNVAAVICSATLPPFTKIGSKLDIILSSIGAATSLDGGLLLMTPMRGPDGSVYAMGEGKIVTTRRNERVGGTTGQSMVTAGVPRGAILEKEIDFSLEGEKELTYYLNTPDFTTAARVAKRLNEELGGRLASAHDASMIHVLFPQGFTGTTVELVSRIESIEVETDIRAKVVMNQRSGTVILGDHVRISPVAIAHNNLRIEIKKEVPADQPEQATPQPAKGRGEEKGQRVMLINQATTIADIVATLNEMGATPDDLISLLQSMRVAGALAADVEMQ